MRNLRLVALIVVIVLSATAVHADVLVATGPTGIPRGDAIGARDITVSNELFAVAFAVDTAPPWGVARGGIVDIAPIHDGEVGYDIASLADFLPNTWTNWPTSYQRVTITKQTTEEVVIKVERDWGEVALETFFTIRDRDSTIHIVTNMTNNGDNCLEGIKSGYVVWPDGGSMFGIPGLYGLSAASEDGALADWTAAYGRNWALGLHAPFAEQVEYGGQDRYVVNDLPRGATLSYEAWLQIENAGSLEPLVQTEIRLRNLDSGIVSGGVSGGDGNPIPRPAIIASMDEHPYAWTIGENGHYEFELPVGEYAIYATAEGHSQGAAKNVTVSKGSRSRLDFADVEAPGAVRFQVLEAETERALDARISIRSGPEPLIAYFGRASLFTELDRIGEVSAGMAPGHYTFEISAGGGFTTVPQVIETTVKSGQTYDFELAVEILARPQAQGWYSADLHHHSDVLDGNTEAEFVMRSELAAAVDIAFLSDHDSVVNNEKMQHLAAHRDVLFMAGTEMSPSWAHFNAFPLDGGKVVDIDTGQSTVQEIFAAARRMGADLIELNHPYMGYGYFSSQEKGEIPGGYDAGFELVEIEASYHDGSAERNQKTIERVWQMWNRGERVYLAAGSDAHDVWVDPSGAARTYVYVEGELSVEKYVGGLKAGRAFASQGPLVYPDIMFGSDMPHATGKQLHLSYTVQAVSGLRSVTLIERGNAVGQQSFDGANTAIAVEFTVSPEANTWYSLVVEDMNGQFAYTNPVWVALAE
ncbi:MAG: CehA/McbA family metallohydrolase [Woeseiaceae bacterium]|nr:CehA/McbA family metallohydrolase [Woeseiaceae bacterium]